jgi:hypothetical protein
MRAFLGPSDLTRRTRPFNGQSQFFCQGTPGHDDPHPAGGSAGSNPGDAVHLRADSAPAILVEAGEDQHQPRRGFGVRLDADGPPPGTG